MFYYFGSKARIAGKYPGPRFGTIVEPFAGSAGYSCRYPSRSVILVERDARVVDLWRSLMAMSHRDIMGIPPPIVGQRTKDLLVMLRAASEHSLTGSYITVTDRMVSRWTNMLKRIATMVPLIQHWRIIHGDYSEAPDIEATWFVDPPYQGLRRGYAYRGIDYDALGAWCMARRGQVIVCERDGAAWLPFRPLSRIVATNNTIKSEAVWLR